MLTIDERLALLDTIMQSLERDLPSGSIIPTEGQLESVICTIARDPAALEALQKIIEYWQP